MQFDFLTLSERLERVCSRRVALRAVALADAWPLFEATRNPAFNKHLLWDRPSDEQEVLQRVDSIVDASRSGRMAALSAVVKQTGEWISLFRFQPNALDRQAVEMGVWTHDRFWHGRYSLELVRLCIDAAFSLSNVHRLIGAAAPANRSSCHLMRELGMEAAKLVHRSTESGEQVALQEFVIDRGHWLSQQERQRPFWQFPGSAGSDTATPPHPIMAKPLHESFA